MNFKKKIFVSLEGGLGNQMFMWLNAKNFADINKSPIYYETFSGFIFGLKNAYNFRFNRYFKLKNFINIKIYKVNFLISFIFLLIRIFNLIFGLKKFSTINLYFLKITIFNDLKQNFDKKKFQNYKQSENEIIFFIGYWQICNFIKNYTKDSILLEKFTENKINNFVRKKIYLNTVAIHIRGNERLYKKINNEYPLPDLNYYIKATDYFKNSNAKFHIYSDDKIYSQKILSFLKLKNFILIEKNFKNDFEQFVLLTKYNKYILSNSTFSILPSLICEKKDKVIFLPNILSIKKIFKKIIKNKNFKFI